MQIHDPINPLFSTLSKYYDIKSKESAATPNSEKNILVIRNLNGKVRLTIVQKHELGFWEKLFAKLGFGNASFTMVACFIDRKIKKLQPFVEEDPKNLQKIIQSVQFLNEKIHSYQSSHSWGLFPLTGNPTDVDLTPLGNPINEPVMHPSHEAIVEEGAQSELHEPAEQDSKPNGQNALPTEQDVSGTTGIHTLPQVDEAVKPAVVEEKDSLILRAFSQAEMAELEKKGRNAYNHLLPAKAMMNQGGTNIPQALKAINNRLVPEFRFATQIDPFTDEEGIAPQCHRAWGTNLDTLVELQGIKCCYPANRVQFGDQTYIQAEAPQQEKENSKAHYYQMAIESGSNMLVAATSGFRRLKDKTTGEWNITPHSDTMDFLNPGESLKIQVPNGPTYLVECENDEMTVEFPEWINKAANLEGPCYYHFRKLKVTNETDSTVRIIHQMVPDFVPVGVPFSLSQTSVDIVNAFVRDNQVIVDKEHPVIVNCITGRDRSGQFIILDSMTREITELSKTMNVDEIFSKTAVVDQLLARAYMLAEQSTEGSGIDSIEQTLLPCFEAEIPVQDRKMYSTLSESEKTKFRAAINYCYAYWFY